MTVASSCCSQGCPSPVPTINRSELSIPDYPVVELTVAETVPGQTFVVTAQVADDFNIPWLVRFWFTDSDLVALLGQESLVPPATPGVSQFHRVTDANGQCSITVNHSGALTKYLNAAVIGRVATTEALVFTT